MSAGDWHRVSPEALVGALPAELHDRLDLLTIVVQNPANAALPDAGLRWCRATILRETPHDARLAITAALVARMCELSAETTSAPGATWWMTTEPYDAAAAVRRPDSQVKGWG